MRLYLDDDHSSPRLADLLRKARFDVQRPADISLIGAHDAVHLTHAIREARICQTRDHGDFDKLHVLIREAQGHHPGILVVRREKRARRNMSPHEIVQAVRKLEAANLQLVDECLILNHWL